MKSAVASDHRGYIIKGKIIAMIADLDRGYTGTVRVDQQPMVELDQKLGSSTGGLKPKAATP